jgi:hypothetical protein
VSSKDSKLYVDGRILGMHLPKATNLILDLCVFLIKNRPMLSAKSISGFGLALIALWVSSCQVYVHTAHTAVVPVALEAKGLMTSGSVDVSGASAEVQYFPREKWSLTGAIQGGNRAYDSFNSLGLSGGGKLYRTSWNSQLGTSYLLGGKDKNFIFPIHAGLMTGGVKQRPEHQETLGTLNGSYYGGYAQIGWLIHANWFQCYAGYQHNLVKYPNVTSDILKSHTLRMEYGQFIGQMGFMINHHFFLKTYLILSTTGSSEQLIDGAIGVWPNVNIGAGLGINLNSAPSNKK